jgi:hypothetical protein
VKLFTTAMKPSSFTRAEVKFGWVCEAWYIVGSEDLGGSLKHFWQGHNNREGSQK